MGASSFNEMELDAIGEIMNISLGASATAVSTMLSTIVNITTPIASVLRKDEFEFKRLEPAIGVEIDYVEGLEGKNIMMFRREDVRIIVNTMMGEETSSEDFELDELHISAICEVMNQMMGASATALSEFLGMIVNISTPKSFEIGEPEDFKDKYFTDEDGMVVVRFRLEIEGKMESEFMNIMPIGLAKKLLAPFEASLGDSKPAPAPAPAPEQPLVAEPEASSSNATMSQAEMDAMFAAMRGESAPAPEPAPAPEASSSNATMSQAEMDAMFAAMRGESAPAPEPAPQPAPAAPTPAPQPAPPVPPAAQAAPQNMMPGGQPYYPYPPMGSDPMMLQLLNQMQQSQMQMMEFMKEIKGKEREREPQKARESAVIHSVNSSSFESGFEEGVEAQENQEMLMKVPLEISVEIGRTKKRVKDILEFTQGSLVVLDKMAGEQADLYVNGQCIAKGDIVVVEDNFGIRITEIISRNINPESL